MEHAVFEMREALDFFSRLTFR